MSKKSAPKKSEETATPALSEQQILAAATNAPELQADEFVLGDRTFKICHLEYDEYLQFTSYLKPLFNKVANMVAGRVGVSIPGIDLPSSLTPGFLMEFCGDHLVTMAVLVCNMQATVNESPELMVDAKWVKKHAKTPFVLSKIVLKQIEMNNMIGDFLDFFVQILPLLKGLTSLQTNIQKIG